LTGSTPLGCRRSLIDLRAALAERQRLRLPSHF
jgi:hypothetical protein